MNTNNILFTLCSSTSFPSTLFVIVHHFLLRFLFVQKIEVSTKTNTRSPDKLDPMEIIRFVIGALHFKKSSNMSKIWQKLK